MTTPNPMDRLITLMSGAVSAGAEDAMRLAAALRDGRIDLEDVQRWYDQRRDQGVELMNQIGDELGTLRKQGVGRFITSSRSAVAKRASAVRRAASRSRRRSLRRRRASSSHRASRRSPISSRARATKSRRSGHARRSFAGTRRTHARARGRSRAKASR